MRVLLWLGWGIVAAGALGEFLVLDKLGGKRGPRPEGEALETLLRYGRVLVAVMLVGFGVVHEAMSVQK